MWLWLLCAGMAPALLLHVQRMWPCGQDWMRGRLCCSHWHARYLMVGALVQHGTPTWSEGCAAACDCCITAV